MKQVQCYAGPTMKIASGLAIQSTIEYSYFFKKKKEIDCRTNLSKKLCSTINFYNGTKLF